MDKLDIFSIPLVYGVLIFPYTIAFISCRIITASESIIVFSKLNQAKYIYKYREIKDNTWIETVIPHRYNYTKDR